MAASSNDPSDGDKKSRLSSIRSGAWSRGMALARMSVQAGSKAAGHALGSLVASDDEDEKIKRVKALLLSQAKLVTRELGELKGSLMKAGQMLSMVGEHFLPPEANAVLKQLQNQSPALDWPAIEQTLRRELGQSRLALLDIDREATASASLGQVHRAVIRGSGRVIALKVQYPGVDEAIDSDLRTLKRVLSLSRLLPGGPRYDALFEEVREMLHQEVDYRRELEETDRFREWLKADSRYIVPETVPEFSTGRVIATSWEPGAAVDSPEVAALSQERRNHLGESALDLYFRELFDWGRMQTDPHFGNYRVRLASTPEERDRLVLYDFGAVRALEASFLDPYRRMVIAGYRKDRPGLELAAIELGLLRTEDPAEHRQRFVDLCFLITEPFENRGEYDWESSDLPKRVAKAGAEYVLSFKLRAPPRELVFLDRKLGGMYVFLAKLRVRFRARDILEKHVSAG